jgi:hypothetical protein
VNISHLQSPHTRRNLSEHHVKMRSLPFCAAALLLPVSFAMPTAQTLTSIASSSGRSDGGITWKTPSSTFTMENGLTQSSKNNSPCQPWQSSCYSYNSNPISPHSAPQSRRISFTGDGIRALFTKEKRHSTEQKRQAKSRCYRNNKVVTCPSTVPLNAASSSFGSVTVNPNFNNKPPGGPPKGHGGPL